MTFSNSESLDRGRLRGIQKPFSLSAMQLRQSIVKSCSIKFLSGLGQTETV